MAHRILVIVAFSLGVGHSASGAGLFMRFDNGTSIIGGSTDPQHVGWSDLSSFQLVFDRTASTGGGGTSGGTNALGTRFSMTIDRAYPGMLQRQLTGYHFANVYVEAFSDGLVIDDYRLRDVVIGDLSVSYNGGAPGTLVGAFLSVGELTLNHHLYTSGGVPTGVLTTMWDYMGNQAASPIALPGDYDHDDDVDGDDYAVWREQFGAIMATIGGGADGNADGMVDAADYTVWRDNLGGFPGLSPTAAPEPGAGLLGAILGLCGFSNRNLRRWNSGA